MNSPGNTFLFRKNAASNEPASHANSTTHGCRDSSAPQCSSRSPRAGSRTAPQRTPRAPGAGPPQPPPPTPLGGGARTLRGKETEEARPPRKDFRGDVPPPTRPERAPAVLRENPPPAARARLRIAKMG